MPLFIRKMTAATRNKNFFLHKQESLTFVLENVKMLFVLNRCIINHEVDQSGFDMFD